MVKSFFYHISCCRGVVVALFLLSACANSDNIFRPKPLGLVDTMPGPPEYSKGWKDGCHTGMATMSNSYYQTFYHFKQDPYLTTNKMYYQAWKDSYAYCRQYVLKWTHESIDSPENIDPNK